MSIFCFLIIFLFLEASPQFVVVSGRVDDLLYCEKAEFPKKEHFSESQSVNNSLL